jgi:hypothetical protein
MWLKEARLNKRFSFLLVITYSWNKVQKEIHKAYYQLRITHVFHNLRVANDFLKLHQIVFNAGRI